MKDPWYLPKSRYGNPPTTKEMEDWHNYCWLADIEAERIFERERDYRRYGGPYDVLSGSNPDSDKPWTM